VIRMIKAPEIGGLMPKGFASTTMDIFNPKKKVIIDMIMVQLLSLIIVFMGVLAFANHKLDAADMSYVMGGLFFSLLMLGGVYGRIAR